MSREEEVDCGAETELVIVASDDVHETLSELTKPTVQVVVNGRVIKEDGQSVLVVDRIATQVSKSLPIIASEEARETLASLGAAQGEVAVTITGEVVEQTGHNVLVLDNVIKSRNLPIVLDEKVNNRLSDLMTNEGGEVPVKAKVVSDNGHKYLVLES